MSRFRYDGDVVIVELPTGEREVLSQVLSDLRDLLIGGGDDTLRRLKPPAHPDNAEAEASYRELVDDDLLRSRLEAIETVESTLSGAELDTSGVAAWMQSLNSLRLVLGEQLTLAGVDLVDDAMPDTASAALYEWTGWLLEQLIAAASEHPEL